MGDNMNQLEGGRLYIEGQPVEWDGSLPELEPAEEVEPLPTVPESMELTLTLTPEAAAAIVEALKPAIEEMARALQEFAEWASEVIRKVAAAITQAGNDLMERMLYAANDNPKWWYLYKHAKKYRTRKKYRRRLMQQLLSKLRAANAQEA